MRALQVDRLLCIAAGAVGAHCARRLLGSFASRLGRSGETPAHESKLRPDVVSRLCSERQGPPGRLGVPHLFIDDGTPPQRVALIVVDLQENFFELVPANHGIVPAVNRAARTLRESGGLVVWITSDVGPDALDNWSVMYDNVFGAREQAVKTMLAEGGKDFGPSYDPMRAKHGMDGPLHAKLDVDVGRDLVIKKDRHSAFTSGGRQQGRTAADGPAEGAMAAPGLLERRLRDAGVDTVLIAGCLTNCCCQCSGWDAMQRNFRVALLADGCAARSEADHNAALNNAAQIFADVMFVDEALAKLAVD